MAGFSNPFASLYVPALFSYELWMFGSTVEYLPDYESSQSFPVMGVWKEGAEGESLSPGRYSVFWIATDSVPDKPKRGDGVQKDDRTYDVVDVQATATGHSRLLLQENLDG
jgi:hypothetical protein